MKGAILAFRNDRVDISGTRRTQGPARRGTGGGCIAASRACMPPGAEFVGRPVGRGAGRSLPRTAARSAPGSHLQGGCARRAWDEASSPGRASGREAAVQAAGARDPAPAMAHPPSVAGSRRRSLPSDSVAGAARPRSASARLAATVAAGAHDGAGHVALLVTTQENAAPSAHPGRGIVHPHGSMGEAVPVEFRVPPPASVLNFREGLEGSSG